MGLFKVVVSHEYSDNLAVTAAVSNRVEVMAQADYVIAILGQVELFVQIKLTEKDVTGAYLCYAALECHWNTRLKRWVQCRGL